MIGKYPSARAIKTVVGSALLFAFYVYVFAFGGCTALGAALNAQ